MRLGIVLWWHCKQNSWTKKRILSGCTKHVYVTMTRWGHPIWLGCKLAESKIFLCVILWSHHAQFIMGTLSSLHKCTKSMEQNQGSNHAKFDFNSSQLRSRTSYLILTFNALSSIFCPHSLDSWSNPYSSVLTFYFLKTIHKLLRRQLLEYTQNTTGSNICFHLSPNTSLSSILSPL